jgi:hypothetical protein
VDGTHCEAAHHLVSFGYLILDDEPDVGQGGQKLGDRLLVAFAAGLLVRKQFRVADVIRSHHLVQRVYVGLAPAHVFLRLVDTADQCLVLFR